MILFLHSPIFFCILNISYYIVLYGNICVPYYVQNKIHYINHIFYIYTWWWRGWFSSLHASRASHLLFIHFFCCCGHLAIWQFTLRTEKKPTEIARGEKKFTSMKPGPSISKKKMANDFFFEGGNFGEKYHQNQLPKGRGKKLYELFGATVFLNSPMLGHGHSSHLY